MEQEVNVFVPVSTIHRRRVFLHCGATRVCREVFISLLAAINLGFPTSTNISSQKIKLTV